jgi:hypothetical protein
MQQPLFPTFTGSPRCLVNETRNQAGDAQWHCNDGPNQRPSRVTQEDATNEKQKNRKKAASKSTSDEGRRAARLVGIYRVSLTVLWRNVGIVHVLANVTSTDQPAKAVPGVINGLSAQGHSHGLCKSQSRAGNAVVSPVFRAPASFEGVELGLMSTEDTVPRE